MTDHGADRWTHPAVILVTTDLTDLDRLMPFALKDAGETGARLILLHVLAAGSGLAVDPTGMPFYDPASAFEFAAKALQPWCAIAREKKIACDALVREGNPAQQIAASVRQFQVDRMILGTRSRSKLTRLLLGSVAEQVLRSVNLPVITVGPEAHLPVESGDAEKIVLHATALRETSRPSAALACHIAASQGAKLVLLHVLPPMDEMQRAGFPTGLDSTAMQELRRLAQETGDAASARPTRIDPCVAHGNPSIEILAASSELHASLIVLGATQRAAFQNLTHDRTIYRVLAHARCPVLSLREAASAQAEGDSEHLAFRM